MKTPISIVRSLHRVDRDERAARQALAADLATYNTPADLRDLEAILERHDDVDAAPIRALVDWTRAA